MILLMVKQQKKHINYSIHIYALLSLEGNDVLRLSSGDFPSAQRKNT